MKLQIKIKSVYGVKRIYPADEIAEKFTKLINTKTFSEEHLAIIKSLGYEIEQLNSYDLKEVV